MFEPLSSLIKQAFEGIQKNKVVQRNIKITLLNLEYKKFCQYRQSQM